MKREDIAICENLNFQNKPYIFWHSQNLLTDNITGFKNH